MDHNTIKVEMAPKRLKFGLIGILIVLYFLIAIIFSFIFTESFDIREIFDDFFWGGLIGLVISALIIINPFSRKCWI